jgi:hypothetical protein
MKRGLVISFVAVAAVGVAAAVPRSHPDPVKIAAKYLVPSYTGRYRPAGAYPGRRLLGASTLPSMSSTMSQWKYRLEVAASG